uniref:Uncharacterized protein n=1 Tax=Coccidioides posadasii RMSCC 3488 TaxID=454284 RepID=A0A0J6I6A1_COCPO|nr:hypothetical protein CPAG_03283 [Coccidioides posadasii RMSCC 3488]
MAPIALVYRTLSPHCCKIRSETKVLETSNLGSPDRTFSPQCSGAMASPQPSSQFLFQFSPTTRKYSEEAPSKVSFLRALFPMKGRGLVWLRDILAFASLRSASTPRAYHPSLHAGNGDRFCFEIIPNMAN